MALVKDPLNIIISGVGGQGNILASELLASALVDLGYYATVGETYGASQRGGPVMSHVRVSSKIQYGPLIPRGEADIIVGFEPLETLRVARDYANKSTRIIFNPRPNYPLSVLIGESKYPPLDAVIQELTLLGRSVQKIEATELAREAGQPQAANVVLLGAMTALPETPISRGELEEILKQRFSGPAMEINRAALELGYKAACS